MAVTTCIHGFASGQCLICQTLQGSKDRPAKEQDRAQPRPAELSPRPTPVRPDAVLTDGAPGRRSLAWRAVGVVVILALVVLVGIWIVGLAFAVLRIIELVAVAVVAAWVGYHVGVYRGRHLGSKH